MPLLNKNTRESLQSLIEKVSAVDYEWIESSEEYSFDWKVERDNEVYKIFLVGKEHEILGMMSIIDHPEEYRIHLNLIEVGASNVGKDKTIENITGSLIAFACQLAFLRGYFGFVSLQPKTQLIALYQSKYGFCQYGKLLAIQQESSRSLIDKYLENE